MRPRIRIVASWSGWTLLRRVTGDVAANVFGFAMSFVAVGMLVSVSRAPIEGLVKHGATWLALVLVTTYVVATLYLLSIVDRKHLHGETKAYTGAVAGFVGGCALLCVYVAALSTYVLARSGVLELASHGKPEDLLPDLLDGFLWYLLEMLPGLDANSAIGWEKQMILEGGGKGWMLLGFRLTIVLCLFRLAARVLEEESAGPTTLKRHDQAGVASNVNLSSAVGSRLGESAVSETRSTS